MFEILVSHYIGTSPEIDDVAKLWCRGAKDRFEPMTEDSQHYLDKIHIEQKRRGL
jgi:hypothetical protein